MKTGMELDKMAEELQRQARVRKDYKLPSGKISMAMVSEQQVAETADVPRDSMSVLDNVMNMVDQTAEVTDVRQVPRLVLDGEHVLSIGSIAHDQISARLKIPLRYYKRMLDECPELLAENVNTWFNSDVERKMIRMVRTLDGTARAFVSDRYRPLDNVELLAAILPPLVEAKVKLVSCDLTERRMYIKAVSEWISAEVKIGDIVQAGILISNSEVGLGALKIQPLIFRLSCLNGAIIPDKSMNKYHTGGGAAGLMDENNQWFKDDTLKQADKAFFMQVQDTVAGVMNQELFNGEVEKIRDAAERGIEAPLPDVVEIVGKRFDLTEGETGQLLNTLSEGGELNQWGMANAMTLMSQSVKSYDRATELEEVGGELIMMTERDWQQIAT